MAATQSVVCLAVLLGGLAWAGGPGGQTLDIQRAKELFRRSQQGEILSPEDQAYLDRVRKEVRRRQQQREGTGATDQAAKKRRNLGPVPPPTSSTGLIPLTDLGTNKYKGEDGGLYGRGSNEPPPGQLAAVEKQLKLVQPLDADGNPASDGKIAFLSVGMSNTTMEFQTFKRKADADPQKSPNVVLVDGAQGGRVAMFGGSHGGHVAGRMASRVSLACAVLCAPAGLDLIALSHLAERGVAIGGNQRLIRQMERRSGVKMADIEKNPDAYQYSSLYTEVPNVQCPILLISGRNDVNAPLAVMDAYVDKLHTAGKEAETYHPENGPHGFYVGLPRPIPETAESTRRAVAFVKMHFEQASSPK